MYYNQESYAWDDCPHHARFDQVVGLVKIYVTIVTAVLSLDSVFALCIMKPGSLYHGSSCRLTKPYWSAIKAQTPARYQMVCDHLYENKTALEVVVIRSIARNPVAPKRSGVYCPRPVDACQVADRIVLLLQSCCDGVDLSHYVLVHFDEILVRFSVVVSPPACSPNNGFLHGLHFTKRVNCGRHIRKNITSLFFG
jgi:hypothetical protein